MSYKLDQNARYAKTDEWVRLEGATAVVGITDYAQNALSDLVYVELPEKGASLAKGDQVATVESVKAASDIYMPLAGTISEVNSKLEDSPELINHDPFGEAWLFKFEPDDPSQIDDLMDAAAYAAYCETREH